MRINNLENLSGLSTNDSKVLLALLEQENPIPTNRLAEIVGISISKARYSTKKIASVFELIGIELIQKPNEGILVNASRKQRNEIRAQIEKLSNKKVQLNSQQRKNLIIQMLLISNNISLHSISDKFTVSSTSFYRDLKEAKKWLNSREISINNENNKKINIEGSEVSIRNTIQEILLDNLGENFILQSCFFSINKIQVHDFDQHIFLKEIHPYLDSLCLPACEKQIRLWEEKHGCTFLDRVHIELTLFLGITASRLRNGYFIKNIMLQDIKSGKKYLQETQSLFQSLNVNFNSRLMQWEYLYFSYLISIAMENSSLSKNIINIPKMSNNTREVSKKIIRESAKYFYAGLNGDNELIDCIEWELSHLSNPKSNNSQNVGIKPLNNQIRKIIKPILIDEIGQDFSVLSLAIANHIRIALEKARSAYLKRRVLIVCGAGMATAYSLKSQINTKFPQIEITGITSAFELAHNTDLLKDCDAVITTIPLGKIIEILQIQVNTFLTKQDIDNIERILELSENKKEYIQPNHYSSAPVFPNILTCKTIRCQVEAKSPHDVIEISGQLLLNKDAIWPSYIKAMKDLYDLYGPYMVMAPNTAFFHAGPEMGAKKLSISLVTLKVPVVFNHKDLDPIKIAIAFSSPLHTNHTQVLSEVFSFFSQEKNRQRLLSVNHPFDIHKIIRDYFIRESLSLN